MRYCIIVFTFFVSLMAGLPAHAATFNADIGGMRITITKPWYLLYGMNPNNPELLFFTLMEYSEGGGDIKGEGAVLEFPVAKGSALPSPEQLKAMNAAKLQELVGDFDQKYGEFSEMGKAVELVEANDFTAVVRKQKQDPTAEIPETEYSFRYYFPLGDRLVILDAYVYGEAGDAATLEAICASFTPPAKAASGQASANVVTGDGMSLTSPGSWSLVMSGITSTDQVWAELEKNAGMEGEIRVARLSVLAPVAAASLPPAQDLESRLRGAEKGEPLTFLGMGTRAELENAKIARTESVKIHGLPATLTVITGKLEGAEIALEVRDIAVGDKVVSLVTGYPLPLPDDVRKELEAIYASFVPAAQ